MALLSTKKKTVSSILKSFDKLIGELESHAHSQHEDAEVYRRQIADLSQRASEAEQEAKRAASAAAAFGTLIGASTTGA